MWRTWKCLYPTNISKWRTFFFSKICWKWKIMCARSLWRMTTSLFLCATVIGNFSGFDLGPAPRIFTKLLKFQCHYLLRKFAINKPENRGLKMAKETLMNSYINLSVNYSNLTRSKIKEIDFKLQKQDCQPQTSTIGSNHSG